MESATIQRRLLTAVCRAALKLDRVLSGKHVRITTGPAARLEVRSCDGFELLVPLPPIGTAPELSIAVPTEAMLDLLRDCKDPAVMLGIAPTGLSLLGATLANCLTAEDAKSFVSRPPDGEAQIRLPMTDLAERMAAVRPATSSELVRQVLTNIFVEADPKREPNAVNFVASDGTWLARAWVVTPTSAPATLLIPDRAAEVLISLAPEAEGEAGLHCGPNDPDRVGISSRAFSLSWPTAGGSFPDYRQVIPALGDLWIVKPKELLAAVKKAGAVVKKARVPAIAMAFESKAITVHGIDQQLGETKVTVAAEGPKKKPVCAFNWKKLASLLAAAADQEILWLSPAAEKRYTGMVVSSPNDFCAVIMPIAGA